MRWNASYANTCVISIMLAAFPRMCVRFACGYAQRALESININHHIRQIGQGLLLFLQLRAELLYRHTACKEENLLAHLQEVRFLFQCAFKGLTRYQLQQLILETLCFCRSAISPFMAFFTSVRNQEPVDLVRAFKDTVDAGVLIDAFHLVLLDIPIAPVNLYRLVCPRYRVLPNRTPC